MSGESVIKRNFEAFQGIHRGVSRLTRDELFAEESTNVLHLRDGHLTARTGCKRVGDNEAFGYGLHEYEYSARPALQFTGYQDPGLVDTPVLGSSSPWANPTNAQTSNNAYAQTTSTSGSRNLVASDFDFSMIPANAVIVGAVVRVELADGGSSTNHKAALTFDAGNNLSGGETKTFTLTSSDTFYEFGSSSTLLGLTSINQADTQSSDFGVAYRIQGASSGILSCDVIQMGLYYQVGNFETERELLAIGDELFRRKEGSLEITYSGSNTATFSYLPDNSSGNYQADLQENGSSISGWPKTYSGNLETLRADIDAESDYAAVLTPNASVNGAVSTNSTITVDASPQTFVDGDRIRIPDSDKGYDVYRHIHNISGTSVNLDAAVSVADNIQLGLGAEPARILPIQDGLSLPISTAVTIKVPFFEQVPTPFSALSDISDRPFRSGSWTGQKHQTNFSFVNSGDNVYWGVPFVNNVGDDQARNTGLWKYDGQQAYWAGLPPMPATSALAGTTDTNDSSSGSGSLTANATYKYKFQLVYYDNRGNVIEGPLSDTLPVTLGGSDDSAYINMSVDIDGTLWPVNSALFPNSAQTSTNTLTVTTGHSIRPGMKVFFWDQLAEEYTERIVESTTKTTITIQGSAVTVDPTTYTAFEGTKEYMSGNLRISVWRTSEDANIFRYWGDVNWSDSIQFVDIKADTELGVELVQPDRYPDLFPKLSYLTLHQGLLVGSGNPDDPQKVYYGDAVNPEASPITTNRFSVPGGKGGRITALASDTDEMLAVFKEDSYTNVVGDLDALSFTLISTSDKEYGCPAHAALVKAKENLIFPSTTGFKVISAGRLITDFDDRLLDDFQNNFYTQEVSTAIDSSDEDKLVLRRAVAEYNPETDEYVCYIPAESGTPEFGGTLRPNNNDKIFVYNLRRQSWHEWKLGGEGDTPMRQNMAGGMAFHKRKLFWSSRHMTGNTFGADVYEQNTTQSQYDYHDDCSSYEWQIVMQPDSLGEISSFFRPLKLKLYQFATGEYLTSFTLTVGERRDYSSSATTTATRTFTSSTDGEKIIKFRTGKARVSQLVFENLTLLLEKPLLSGWEYLIRQPYASKLEDRRG